METKTNLVKCAPAFPVPTQTEALRGAQDVSAIEHFKQEGSFHDFQVSEKVHSSLEEGLVEDFKNIDYIEEKYVLFVIK